MKITRLHITIVLALTTLIWGIVLWIQGVEITGEHFAPFGTVVSALVLLSLLTEKWLWSLKMFTGWLFKRPDLRGTWYVNLVSDYVDPATNKPTDPIDCYLNITQSFSSLQMHLMTPESESWLVASSIDPSPKGIGFQISTVYTNRPGIQLRGDRSEIHYGSFRMETHGDIPSQPSQILGEYWTDRKTRGTMDCKRFSGKNFTTYEQAAEGYHSTT